MRLSPGSNPSIPFLLTTVHLSLKVWAGLRLTSGTNISSSPIACVHHPKTCCGLQLLSGAAMISTSVCLPAGLRLNAGTSPSVVCQWREETVSFKGVEEETKDWREWKRWAQLIYVAIECTVIRLHHSVPLSSPGYNLENTHCNRL